jgi:DNA-binding CsgD family transcriptional regulator
MTNPIDFNSVLSLIDRTISPTYLNNTQEIVLREVWNGKTYSRMACDYNYDPEYIKTVGCNLWQILSNAFNEQINKSNFVPYMRQKISCSIVANNRDELQANQDSKALASESLQPDLHHWATAPNITHFVGRDKQIKLLESWSQDLNCNCIIVTGMVGSGKTSLITKFAKNIQNQFDYVIWFSLSNSLSPITLTNNFLKIIDQNPDQSSNSEFTQQDLSSLLAQLIDHLKQKRILLVLDDLESILEIDQTSICYQRNLEDYGHILRSIIATNHQSLLICASRIRPKSLEYYGMNQIKNLDLQGFEKSTIEQNANLETSANLENTKINKAKLLHLSASLHYNPQLLKITASHLDIFHDDHEELEQVVQELSLLEEIGSLLEQELDCLAKLEKEIIFWLAISCQPISRKDLANNLKYSQSKIKFNNNIKSLEKRSLIVQDNSKFTLMPIMKSYLRRKLVQLAL